MTEDTPMTPPISDLHLAEIRRDERGAWIEAAGMTTADTTEEKPKPARDPWAQFDLDQRRSRQVVMWVLWSCWGTGIGAAAWFVWRIFQ